MDGFLFCLMLSPRSYTVSVVCYGVRPSGEEGIMQTWNLEQGGQFMCAGKGEMYRERQYTDELKPLRL